jgi:hypothetical protein
MPPFAGPEWPRQALQAAREPRSALWGALKNPIRRLRARTADGILRIKRG